MAFFVAGAFLQESFKILNFWIYVEIDFKGVEFASSLFSRLFY
jgi:hypothetical protein